MTRPRIGTVFLPAWAPEQLKAVALAAEASGLDDLWFWEDCFAESGPSPVAAALAWTDRLRVGLGLMPVPLRNVAITAMEVATIERLFPGRFAPVIGHGVQRWMSQLGVKAESPLTLLTEYAEALTRLLGGENVTVAGRYVSLEGVALSWPPAPPPALLIGGEGPKTLTLAATHGDGTMLTSALSEDRIRESCELVLAAADGPHQIVAHLMVTHGPDAAALLEHEMEDWPTASRGVGIAAADPGEVAAAIDRLAGFGVTTVLVHSVGAEPDPAGFATWVGDEVSPLVSA
ncbi:MAG: LLM class flavin-dependent oxidoreductase [Pseudolysinimonas sp.]